jgi:hypothetical protein
MKPNDDASKYQFGMKYCGICKAKACAQCAWNVHVAQVPYARKCSFCLTPRCFFCKETKTLLCCQNLVVNTLILLNHFKENGIARIITEYAIIPLGLIRKCDNCAGDYATAEQPLSLVDQTPIMSSSTSLPTLNMSNKTKWCDDCWLNEDVIHRTICATCGARMWFSEGYEGTRSESKCRICEANKKNKNSSLK